MEIEEMLSTPLTAPAPGRSAPTAEDALTTLLIGLPESLETSSRHGEMPDPLAAVHGVLPHSRRKGRAKPARLPHSPIVPGQGPSRGLTAGTTGREADGVFRERLNGRFWGVLRWRDLDVLWRRVREHPEGWYVSQTGDPPPCAELPPEKLIRFIKSMNTMLRREHKAEYCGIVQVDDPTTPAFIKIHDPHDFETTHASCHASVPPRWVLSRVPPTRIHNDRPLLWSRQRWWHGLFT